MNGKPESDDDAQSPAPPATKLADFVRAAREQLGPEPDRTTPAATKTMAAVIRDLKGLPEVSVKREGFKLKLGRRGKVASITLEYQEKIRAMELGYVSFPDADPTAVKLRRYTCTPDGELGVWERLDGAGELIDDIKEALTVLYPELGPR